MVDRSVDDRDEQQLVRDVVGGPVGLRQRPAAVVVVVGEEERRRRRRRREEGWWGGEDEGGGGERAEEGEGGDGAWVPVDQGQVPAEEVRWQEARRPAAGLGDRRLLIVDTTTSYRRS